MNNINVLVFPCGSEVGLEINKSLKDIYFINLYGGSSIDDHGKWEYENYIGNIPFINDESFVDKLNEIIEKYNIDFIFPALDSVLLKLAEVRNLLKAKVLMSSNETVSICRNKNTTYKHLNGCDFLPGFYLNAEEVKEYPVLLKPAVGQGAQGVKIVKNYEELIFELKHRKEEQAICEYLPGTEYTVDCFTDKYGKLKFCSHRSRRRIKSGISVNSVLESFDKRIEEIALIINSKFCFRGAWFFQVKLSKNNEYKLMEIGTRVAGTMCVQRARGVNLPLLTVFDGLGYDIDVKPQFDFVETDRALTNCYNINFKFDELYIDYDDTLVIHNKINLQAITLLYKCVNNGIPVILITKHLTDIYAALDENKIDDKLFKKIIQIKPDEHKFGYITPSKDALFLDDSFKERREIIEKFGIKAVGVDMLEVFLNGVIM